MSDLEFYCWLDEERLPQGTNFASDPIEAISLGLRYVINGDLIIFSTDYDPECFNSTMVLENEKAGWYQTNKHLFLRENIFEIHSPREAVEDYQRMIKKKVFHVHK